ncbi:MAG: LysR family transcriptional regulator [Candidatus Cloacimonetes bacterium]|nr:LysR family transcriptional regulator [Candidatus Cloacimonadota bacterium]
MINGNYLKYFYWTVKKGSTKKAGAECHKTQSAISQAISKLEHSLDTTLLTRYSNSFELTNEGKELFIFAKNYIESYNDLQNKLNAPKVQKPKLRIGISKNYEDKVNLLIRDFIKEYVSYELIIEALDGDIIRKRFSEGKYDLIFGINFEADDRIPTSAFEHNSLPLFYDKIGLCAHKDHHELQQNSSLEDLLSYPMILSDHIKNALTVQLEKESLSFEVAVIANNSKTIACLLQDTDYIAMLCQSSIPKEYKSSIQYFNEPRLQVEFPITMNYRTESAFGSSEARTKFVDFAASNTQIFR